MVSYSSILVHLFLDSVPGKKLHSRSPVLFVFTVDTIVRGTQEDYICCRVCGCQREKQLLVVLGWLLLGLANGRRRNAQHKTGGQVGGRKYDSVADGAPQPLQREVDGLTACISIDHSIVHSRTKNENGESVV